jgi:hypothetical protein
MSSFDEVWKKSAGFRKFSRELPPLIRALHDAVNSSDVSESETRNALEALLLFLSSPAGRTDANCCATDAFFSAVNIEGQLERVPPSLRSIVSDLSGALHDAIYAPQIARTFDSLPEQLLERIRRVNE